MFSTQIFLILSQMDPKLPGWDLRNWQSNIRHLARAHPKFADLERWRGRETSDMTYQDNTGVLTKFLREKDYLGVEWADAKPLYYLEVKSTLGPCASPFYMSSGQMERVSYAAPGSTIVTAVFALRNFNGFLIINAFIDEVFSLINVKGRGICDSEGLRARNREYWAASIR